MKHNITCYIISCCLIVASYFGCYCLGYRGGTVDAYDQFISGECWLSTANGDVNCTIHISD